MNTIAAVVAAGAGLFAQASIAASASSNAYLGRGLLLRYDAPALVATVILIGSTALLVAAIAASGVAWSRDPAFLLLLVACCAASVTAGFTAGNWRVFTDAATDVLRSEDHLHPVVALVTYPRFAFAGVIAELLVCIGVVAAIRRTTPRGGV